MKQKLLKTWLVMLCMLVGIGSVWAEDATMAAGTNGSAAKVNDKDAIKVGTSSKGGDMTITVPAGATSLEFYAAAWNGVTGLSLNITPAANVSPTSVSLTADSGISGNSPFTLSGTESNYKFTIALSNITAETKIKLTSSTTKRFVVWGATYTSGGGSTSKETYNVNCADGVPGGVFFATPTTASEGATITLSATPNPNYVLESWSVTNISTSEAITVTNNKFTMPASDVNVSATFKEKVDPSALTTMDEIYAKATEVNGIATDVYVKFDNWIVSGLNGSKNAYVTDGEKGFILYDATESHGFAVGDILSGTAACKVQLFNASAEITALTSTTPGLTVTKGGTVAEQNIAISALTGKNTGALLSYEGLTYHLNGKISEFSDGENVIVAYKGIMSTLPELIEGKTYDVKGVFLMYGEKKEILPRSAEDIVLKEIINNYTISYDATENGTIVVKNGDTPLVEGAEVAEGTELTIECTPVNADYCFKNWQYKAGEAAWATRTTDFTYTMPSTNVKFRANFELIPTYTVAWSVNGTIVKSEDLKEGAAVTAPEVVVPDYTDKVFTGWVETSTVAANETPAYVTPATTASEDVTYYAVFAEKVSDGNVTWTVVDNVNNLKDGDVVIIATQKGFTGTGGMKTAGEISNNLLSCTASTFSQDNTTITNVADGTVEFTLAKSSTEWQFVNGGKYLAMIGDKNVGLVDNTSTWSISINRYLATVSQNYTKSGATSASTYKLQYNYNNGNDRFTGYTSSQTSISLYKKSGSEAAYSDFTTTVSAPTPDHGTLTLVATNDDGYWATFSSDKDVIFDANDIIAYTVAVDDNKLVMIDANANSLSCVTDKTKDDGWVAGYYVQAGAAVLINSLENSVNYYYIDTDPYTANNLDEIEMDPEYNMLRPSNVEMTGNCLFYKLAYGDWENKKDLGFFWGADNGAAFDTWTGGAYLAVPTSVAAAKGFTFDGAATAISNVNADAKANSSAYNLAGQRVKANVKGLIIMNGKKYLNK